MAHAALMFLVLLIKLKLFEIVEQKGIAVENFIYFIRYLYSLINTNSPKVLILRDVEFASKAK